VTPLLYRSSLRYLLRHPWQIGLAVLGVALGVAVVVAVDLANASALLAFDLSTEAVTGRATHQVVSGPGGLPDETYRQLVLAAEAAGSGAAAPVVEDWVTAGGGPYGKGGRTLHLLGIDPFAEAPFRPYLATLGGGAGAATGPRGPEARIDLAGFLTRPGAALLAGQTARELAVGVAGGGGQRLRLHAEGRAVEVLVLGTIEPRDESTRRAVADILSSISRPPRSSPAGSACCRGSISSCRRGLPAKGSSPAPGPFCRPGRSCCGRPSGGRARRA